MSWHPCPDPVPGDAASVDVITVSSTRGAQFMVFGGEPMDGPRYVWWNFVSSRRERIEQAQEEWRQGRFDSVPGDEAEFIPLPEAIGRPREITPQD